MTDKDPGAGPPAVRLGRALASPVGVLITIPLLVILVGVGIMLVGRDATNTASHAMARRQLAEQATAIQTQVAFALDQAGPLLERLRELADPAHPLDDALIRMHDLIIGRPGVAYASVSFPEGTFRGAYVGEQGRIEAQESRLGERATNVVRYTIEGGTLARLREETTDYDPRKRGFYELAVTTRARAWTAPYTFFGSFETGITCTEPLYGPAADGTPQLLAVLTVDFDIRGLSSYVARPALDEARSVVYTHDGTILAYPAADRMQLPTGNKLLRHEDFHDPAVTALFTHLAPAAATDPPVQFRELDTPAGAYLTSIAPIAGNRAGVAVPLDWYVATLVPARTLLGPTTSLVRTSVIASAGALAIAVALALVLAWNLVRMRRQVAASREEARSAEARARDLGSYRLVARLGQGGMGEVWRAEHRLLARTAAIKLIRPEALADPEAEPEIRERFRREAQTLASMRSRHTIAIFDYGVTEAGVYYYVMELLDGLDLESLVIKDGPQPAARVIRLMAQACASLAEAHAAGLLHRDIKPPNLFASRAADEVDIVKLLDFGIVQTLGDVPAPSSGGRLSQPSIAETPKLTQLGAMLGTPGFMAPEQILGMQLDGRADLYALGCVAWWLLTGREVFAREGADVKILHRHIYDPVPSLRGKVKGWYPPELEAVLHACLAKDAGDRPIDARHLAAMLRAIEIPDEHAWTEARALAWWDTYQPALPAPSVSPSEIQVIMPGATDQRGHGADASLSVTALPPGVDRRG